VFFAVPRIWERFHSRVALAVADATLLQRLAYRWAIGTGEKRAASRLGGGVPSLWIPLWYALAQLLVLRNIRRELGLDRVRIACAGAAPISPDLLRWYLALGIDILELYGQTECAGLATAMPALAIRLGTVGLPLPYAELSLSAEGEILLRGEHVFEGYWNDPAKTAETIRDGWLHTGDLGALDASGYVRVTDRLKDVIITAGGKNVTPSEIENELKFSPYIADAMVIGDRRKFLSCLVMIDHETVEKWAQDHDVPYTNFTSLTRTAEVRDLIDKEIGRANAKFARVESIRAFRLIEQKLEAEDPELTPTMKLRRRYVSEKYRDLIESMYYGA